MRSRMRIRLCFLALAFGSTACADIVSEAIEDIELTVYRDPNRDEFHGDELSLEDESDGIAMVTETRTIEIPAGAATIRFRGVADGIVPQTATLDGLPATIVEANFDYNLLTPGTLIEKSIDRPVRLIRTNRTTGEVEDRRGMLRSGPDGVVVDFGDAIEALNCSGLDERLVFDDVPGSLTDTPTLSLSIHAPSAGTYRVRLSYLALGMDWSASYVARLHPDGSHLDLSGWITLVNRHGARFSNAKTHVVAGKLARQQDATLAPEIDLPRHRDQCWPIGDFRLRQRIVQAQMLSRSAAGPSDPVALESIVVTGSLVARESQLGDYKLYTLPFATTVEPRQMKQARLLERPDVRVDRAYEFRLTDDILDEEPETVGARTMLQLTNSRRMGLGLPLPAGMFRIMQTTPDGRQFFIGEQYFDDTPVDLPRRLELGESNDVTVSARVVELEDDDEERGVIEIEVGNAGTKAAQIRIIHPLDLLTNAKITRESHRHRREDGNYVWTLRVGAGKRTVLRYTVTADDEQ